MNEKSTDVSGDFKNYKTFAFDEETMKMEVNQLNRDRILKAIENEMTKKGFTKSDNPDIMVNVVPKTKTKVQATANTTGMGGYGGYGRYGRYGGYGYGGGFSTTQINYDEYIDGTIFISLIDEAEKKMVWQGRVTKTLNENANANKREKNINYAIQSVFSEYPPKIKEK